MISGRKYYIIALILWLFLSPCAYATFPTDGANLMQKLPASIQPGANTSTFNMTAQNQIITLHEFHQIQTANASSVSAIQKYINCPNGGIYVLNTLAEVNSNLFYYFCDLNIYPWYLDQNNPTYYDPGQTTTYYQMYTGLVPNPLTTLPSSVGSEQISIEPIYATGIPITTIITDNCFSFPYWSSFGDPSNSDALGSYSSLSVSLTTNGQTLGSGTISAVSSDTYQCTYAGYSATLIPGQNVNLSKTPSGLLGSVYPFNAGEAQIVNMYGFNEIEVPASVGYTNPYYVNEPNCSAGYTIQQQDIGQTIWLSCCWTNWGMSDSMAYRAPGSGFPASGGSSVQSICGASFPANSFMPVAAPQGVNLTS